MKEPSSALRRLQSSPGGSLQQQLYEYLSAKISREEWQVGDFLPSTRELARTFQTSISPVHGALDQLAEEGIVAKIHGSGVRVLARGSSHAFVRSRPNIDLITTITQPDLQQPPSKDQHLLPAIEKWLLWALSNHPGLRLTISPVQASYSNPSVQQGLLRERINEAEIMRASVAVFASPEFIEESVMEDIRACARRGLRVVYLATGVDLPECDQVRSDFAQGQAALTRHLLRSGHSRILRMVSNPTMLFETQKSQGFREALLEFGIRADTANRWSVTGIADAGPARERIDFYRNLLGPKIKAEKITAVMAVNDPVAADVRIALHELGLHGQVEVTGYDADWSEMDWTEKYPTDWLKLHAPLLAPDARPLSVGTRLPAVAQALADLVISRAFHLGDAPPRIITVSQELSV